MCGVSDFEVGRSYTVRLAPWEVPDGSDTMPAAIVTFTVLPALALGEALASDLGTQRYGLASPSEVEAREEFLRVRWPDGRVRLLHPQAIEAISAEHDELPSTAANHGISRW